MNFGKKPPDFVIDILKQNGIQYGSLSYHAWPQMFSDSSGPRGGMAGQTISFHTVEAWVCDGSGPTVYICSGMYVVENVVFIGPKNITGWQHIIDWPNTDQGHKTDWTFECEICENTRCRVNKKNSIKPTHCTCGLLPSWEEK